MTAQAESTAGPTAGSIAFATLAQAYEDRMGGLREARARGQKVVGLVGNTVPVEAVLAAGAWPLRLAPVVGSTAAADPYVEAFTDLDARLVFALFVEGRLDALDLLLIPRSTENQHKLYLALREARRIGLAAGAPPLWLYDILHTQRPSSRAYGLARTRDLLARLAELTGHAPSDADLAQASARTNATRALLQRLQALREQGRINGRQAQVAAAATRFMAPEAAQQALQAWLDADDFAPARGPRLLVKGVPLEHAQLHALVDGLGGCIVAEDDDWGARAGQPTIATGGDALAAIFEHVHSQVPCPRTHPFDADNAWFSRALASVRVDGVLFYLPRPDDIAGWRFPDERAQVERAGLPWLLVRDDARDAACAPALADRLGEFIAGLVDEGRGRAVAG